MKKSQTPCVQHLSATFAGCFPVHLIANDGITDRMEMDPNLVGSSGEDLAKDEGPTARFLDDFELCLSRPPTVDNSHFLTVHGMTANRLYDFAGGCGEFHGAQRQVEFLNLLSGKLATQPQCARSCLATTRQPLVSRCTKLEDWRSLIFEGVSPLSTFFSCTKKGDHCTLIGDFVRVCVVSLIKCNSCGESPD